MALVSSVNGQYLTTKGPNNIVNLEHKRTVQVTWRSFMASSVSEGDIEKKGGGRSVTSPRLKLQEKLLSLDTSLTAYFYQEALPEESLPGLYLSDEC